MGDRLHNAEKTCWNCPAAKLEGNVDFRSCGQSKEEARLDAEDKEVMIECKRRPELGYFQPTITFEQCPEWTESEYGYRLKDMRVLILGIDGYLGWTLSLKLANLGFDVAGIDNYTRRKTTTEKKSHSIVPIYDMDERLQAAEEVLGVDIEFQEMDYTDRKKLKAFMEKFQPESIVHYAEIPSAPYSMVDAEHSIEVQRNNVLGTLGLLWTMKEVCPEASLVKLGCYDDQTEILTEDGWKLFEDLEEDDKVATRNKEDREMVFKEPNSIHEYDYEGEMYLQKNTRVDFCVTPNHRVFTQKRSNTDYKELRLESVQDVEGERKVYDVGFDWKGKEKKYFTLPAVDENTEDVDIPMKQWLKFLGWYLSEGSVQQRSDRPHNYRVSIKQNQNSENIQELEQILLSMSDFLDTDLNKREDGNCYAFSIGSKQLASYLDELGRSDEKYIPQDFKGLDKNLLEELLFSLIAGDGWKHRPEGNRNNFRYFTNSKDLADDVQEVALKCGFGAIVSYSEPKEGYQINICQTPRVHVNHCEDSTDEWIDYEGKVYCVNVDGDGIVFVRRNGKPVWSGNTMGEYGSPITGRPLFEGMFPSDAVLEWEGREWSMGGELTPRNPPSFYHVSKVNDTYNIYESCKYWWLRSYDIMQGVIFGVHTEEVSQDPRLRTRLDVDEWSGTVVNRFTAQAASGVPLTVYGKGEQTRGFIALEDAMQCMVRLISSPPEPGEYDVVNQVSGVYKIKELADVVGTIGNEKYGLDVEIQRLENPRVEADKHPMEVISRKLPNEFGFERKVSLDEEIDRMLEILTRPEVEERIEKMKHAIMPETQWSGEKEQPGVIEVYRPGERDYGIYEPKLDTGEVEAMDMGELEERAEERAKAKTRD
ncbi:hypothetical protein AKJ37_02760 [candidate division MSBL1 archaeon SCGC-AAA259I09]|uniref:DOD-type homing endonuclease domain-containing protein n=1 Tax=candidate division MSBL1 archaeon SCGC-AAA259I09 TaxID=1698267 RepID=A0A133UTM0_9EURY|nr:hypothetical protein AKJ37_02760 [candidate division MSBL1 archaeon SCGC-AAA259I09]